MSPEEPDNKANTQMRGHGKPAHTSTRPCATSITLSTTLHAPQTTKWPLDGSFSTVHSAAYWKTPAQTSTPLVPRPQLGHASAGQTPHMDSMARASRIPESHAPRASPDTSANSSDSARLTAPESRARPGAASRRAGPAEEAACGGVG
jgi:hypothetical protein